MHLIHVLHYTNAKDEALMMDYLVNSNKGHKVNYIDNDQIRLKTMNSYYESRADCGN